MRHTATAGRAAKTGSELSSCTSVSSGVVLWWITRNAAHPTIGVTATTNPAATSEMLRVKRSASSGVIRQPAAYAMAPIPLIAPRDLWFPPREILLEDGTRALLPVLVMTCAFSRFMLARMIPTRKSEDLLLGSWEPLTQLGAVPRGMIWDNESGIGRRKLTEPAAIFAGTLATKVVLLPPRDPESKGVVERRNGWFEQASPGRVTPAASRSADHGQSVHSR